jgi:type IV pilus assembly protein PilM
MLVLIAAIKKESILQRIKVLENSGLRTNIIDVDSLALVNAFNFNYSKTELPENKSICLLNIGSTITNVNILDNASVRLSRDIHSGGANFTKKLMDVFEVDFKAAEELKINHPQDKIDKIRTCVESVLTNLASEIRTSFDYYESQNSSNVVKIFLSGGASKIPGLKEMLGTCLGLPVETWDPFKQVKIPDTLDRQRLNKFYGQFNVAAGLALR